MDHKKRQHKDENDTPRERRAFTTTSPDRQHRVVYALCYRSNLERDAGSVVWEGKCELKREEYSRQQVENSSICAVVHGGIA